MKYNLEKPIEVEQARQYLERLVKQRKWVEVKRLSPNRSLNQNNYLHLLLGAFGAHFGYNLEEAKTIYKELNKDVYHYEKKGRTFVRSSANLTMEEMAKTIDVLHKWSKKAGYPLPLATDTEWLMQIENEIERSKHYL